MNKIQGVGSNLIETLSHEVYVIENDDPQFAISNPNYRKGAFVRLISGVDNCTMNKIVINHAISEIRNHILNQVWDQFWIHATIRNKVGNQTTPVLSQIRFSIISQIRYQIE